jgi:RNA polymerase sigma-70 factor (ECF subfamily)
MFDNTNSYTLRTEVTEGIPHYFVSFTDGQSMPQETEVTHRVYLDLRRFVRHERNLRRFDERHIEQADLTDEMLFNRAICSPESVEDVLHRETLAAQMRNAIEGLPVIQKRRFLLYHDLEFTYEQIAEIEGCTKRAVKFSVDIAEGKIREVLKK